MKNMILALGMGLIALPALASESRIAGDYVMKGKSLRTAGPGYTGDCTVRNNGNVYEVNCINAGSGDKYVGKGLLRGDHFSLYLDEYLVVYKIENDGRLVGNWSHARSADYGEEILTPKPVQTQTN